MEKVLYLIEYLFFFFFLNGFVFLFWSALNIIYETTNLCKTFCTEWCDWYSYLFQKVRLHSFVFLVFRVIFFELIIRFDERSLKLKIITKNKKKFTKDKKSTKQLSFLSKVSSYTNFFQLRSPFLYFLFPSSIRMINPKNYDEKLNKKIWKAKKVM